jgi:Flp pilus assembly protein TadG
MVGREQWARRGLRSGPGARGVGRRGAALVEFVIVVPLLLLLLLGIMEFGVIMRDYIMLGQATREGARTACIGTNNSVELVKARVLAAAALPDLRSDMIRITRYDPGTGGWVTVGDKPSGNENDAPADSIVRVTIPQYPHQMVTGNFFSWLPGYSNGVLNLSSSLTMRHE